MRKKRKPRKWYILLSLFTIIVMLFIFASMYSEQRLEAARQRLKPPESAREFETLVAAAQAEGPPPSLPPEKVAEARSRMALFAELRSELAARRASNSQWAANEKDFLTGWEDWGPKRRAEAETFLTKNEDLLKEIRRLGRQEGPFYALDLTEGFYTDTEHHAQVGSFARLLSLDAQAKARDDNWKAVLENIDGQLNLSEGLAREPFTISQMMANALTLTAYRTVEDAVSPGALDAEQLHALFSLFEGLPDRERYADALRTEANMWLSFIHEERDWFANHGPFSWLWDINEASYLEMAVPLIEAATQPYYESIEVIENHREALESLPFYKPFPIVASMGLNTGIEGPSRVEASVELLQTGLRIEHYHATHGTYPETLDEIGAAAVDPFSGEPLRYVSNEDGFMLYSVGQDIEDDGGQFDYQDGDIVWRGKKD